MKYLKVYENFMDSMNSNIAADEEADMMKNDEIYSDEETEGIEESQFGAEEILAKWEEAFSDKEPTTQEKLEFYHELRNEGFDGFLIFDTLGSKMDKEEEFSFFKEGVEEESTSDDKALQEMNWEEIQESHSLEESLDGTFNIFETVTIEKKKD